MRNITSSMQHLCYSFLNFKHRFLVCAQIEPVKLELSRTNIKLAFSETNMEMETTEVIKVNNNGNAPGKFKWDVPNNSVFTIKPERGEVPAQSSIDILIIYTPSGTNFKGEADKLILKVEDGEDQALNCMGIVAESKCALKIPSLDLGDIPVSTNVNKFITIKNTYKSQAVFHISNKLPPNCILTPMKGKIGPDQAQDINITFITHEEILIKSDIVINIRGGKPLRLPFTANVSIPKISIKEDEFDFGSITYGNSSTMMLTCINDGTIVANLEVDLEEKVEVKELEGIECVDMILSEGYGDDESSIMLSMNQSLNEDAHVTEGEEPSDSDEDSEEETKQKTVRRQFQVLVS